MDEHEDDVIRPWRIFFGAKLVSLYACTDLEFSFITWLELHSVERKYRCHKINPSVPV